MGAKVGIYNREHLSWALYDWANSAFATTILAAVLPIYYLNIATPALAESQATAYWGYTTAGALAVIALLSPVLGSIADHYGAKKRLLGIFVAMGAVFTSLLFFTGQGDWLLTSALFIPAYIGFGGSLVFYDSLLPHVTDAEGADRLSASAYAFGYMGGGVLLVVNVIWIQFPELFGMGTTATATRYALVSVAAWWVLFSIPLFLFVDEPDQSGKREDSDSESRNALTATETRDEQHATGSGPAQTAETKTPSSPLEPVRAAFGRLRQTFAEIRQYRQLFIFLLAFWLYADGIGTIIKMASIYGASVGIEDTQLIMALILVQFLGIPFAFLFGGLADYIGAKKGIYIGLAVYTLVAIGGAFMSQAWHFWLLAAAVATVQGGTQALSRSLFSTLVPPSKSSEFFGFYSISSKFAGIFGPLAFGLVTSLTGSSRLSLGALFVFFAGGMLLLWFVDVEEGRKVANDAQAAIDADRPGTPAADGGVESQS
jgi:UMF1 family MFS transporter